MTSAQPGGDNVVDRNQQRRLITAVFADVSGFTPLADRLDAEDVVASIEPILLAMATVVRRYGGHVSHYAGDSVVAFFGAPVAHGDDATRAVLAAQEMHREVARVVQGLSPDVQHLRLHIGVNTGHAVTGVLRDGVREDYYALGDAINVAARLQAACPVGEVYVGDLTRRLAGEALRFESLGELDLKGKPEPVPAWRVVAEDQPEGVEATGEQVMLGRERELETARSALTALREGTSGVLAIIGEPGVGKSRLLQAVRHEAEATGVTWLSVRCLSYGAALAYRPFLDLLREMAAVRIGDPPDRVRARIGELADELGLTDAAPYLMSVAGVPGPELPRSVRDDAQALRVRVQDAFVALVFAAAGNRPLVLAVEDVHWIDRASAEVIRLLLTRSGPVPVWVAATARAEGRPIVVGFGGTQPATLVELEGLESDAARRLAENVVGGTIEPAAWEVVLGRTNGNALFVQELVRSLRDSGDLVRTTSGWSLRDDVAAPDVPTTVESVLAARIDMLPDEDADVLLIASVIGREVRLPLLQALVAVSDERFARAVQTLVTRRFVHRSEDDADERLVFHHVLVVDVAYSRLLRKQRRRLHQRLVEAALELYGSGDDSVELLARHAYLGEMGSAAFPYVDRAAGRAAALFANDEALTYLRQAIELAETQSGVSDRLPDLLTRFAELRELTGQLDEAAETYHRVYDMTRSASAAISEAAVQRRLGHTRECLDMLAAVDREHADLTPDHVARIAIERGWASASAGQLDDAIDVVTAGIADLQRAGLDGSGHEADLLMLRGRILQARTAFDDALADLRRALAIVEGGEDRPAQVVALRFLGGLYADMPDGTAESLTILERALTIGREIGHAEETGVVCLNLGWALAHAGRLDEAVQYDREAAAAFESMGLKAFVANANVNLADHLIELEAWEEAERAGEQAYTVAHEIGNRVWSAGALGILSDTAAHRGDYARALALAEESEALYVEMGDESHANARRALIARLRPLVDAG